MAESTQQLATSHSGVSEGSAVASIGNAQVLTKRESQQPSYTRNDDQWLRRKMKMNSSLGAREREQEVNKLESL